MYSAVLPPSLMVSFISYEMENSFIFSTGWEYCHLFCRRFLFFRLPFFSFERIMGSYFWWIDFFGLCVLCHFQSKNLYCRFWAFIQGFKAGFLIKKFAIWFSENEGGSKAVGTFPKIHPFWSCQASLSLASLRGALWFGTRQRKWKRQARRWTIKNIFGQ